jgi:predicted acetyltransferase
MTPVIRPIHGEELRSFIDAMSTGFLDRPDVDKVAEEVRPLWDLSRAWAAFDGDRIVGTFRSWASEITVPGGRQLPAAAVTNVTVLPTHRRRGILRAMTGAEHRAARERGEAASLLYAAEYPIYGRFGYGPACRIATWTLDTRAAAFRTAPTGTVEFAATGPESRDIIRGVYEAWRAGHAGEIRRREFRWEMDLGLRDVSWGTRWKGFLALHRDDAGAVDGYVRYRAEEKWEQNQPRSTVQVDELHSLTDDAYLALWRFVADVDLVARVKAESRTPSERLPWLLVNARAVQVSDVADGMWVRLFDVPRALAARTYDREASIVVEVIDEEVPHGRVCVALEAGLDGATARETTRSPHLTIHVGALGAAYLGGTRLRDAVTATGADEHRPGSLAAADALFRTTDEPWCSTFF